MIDKKILVIKILLQGILHKLSLSWCALTLNLNCTEILYFLSETLSSLYYYITLTVLSLFVWSSAIISNSSRHFGFSVNLGDFGFCSGWQITGKCLNGPNDSGNTDHKWDSKRFPPLTAFCTELRRKLLLTAGHYTPIPLVSLQPCPAFINIPSTVSPNYPAWAWLYLLPSYTY